MTSLLDLLRIASLFLWPAFHLQELRKVSGRVTQHLSSVLFFIKFLVIEIVLYASLNHQRPFHILSNRVLFKPSVRWRLMEVTLTSLPPCFSLSPCCFPSQHFHLKSSCPWWGRSKQPRTNHRPPTPSSWSRCTEWYYWFLSEVNLVSCRILRRVKERWTRTRKRGKGGDSVLLRKLPGEFFTR